MSVINPYKFEMPSALLIIFIIWIIICILQMFLAFGTAYRCTKNGNDNGVGLFIYLLGFGFAALIPGLGLHYYIKHLPPKIVIQQNVQSIQPQVIRVIDPTQMPQNPQNVVYQQQQMPPANVQQNNDSINDRKQ